VSAQRKRPRAAEPERDNGLVPQLPTFDEIAAAPDATMDLLALALAAEFRELDAARALATLDILGAELASAAARTNGAPGEAALACSALLGTAYGFTGDRDAYDDPDNSMLDLVLEHRRGLPILLSIVYIEVARRAQIALAGVGLPGHFVVAQFAVDPPLVLDPFAGGATIETAGGADMLRPWTPHEIAMRMLNNLVGSFTRRGNLAAAIRAASMRLMLPAEEALRTPLQAELRALHSRLN
jgi:regulator of sirC expression with transglutaminase-like and TPR domain